MQTKSDISIDQENIERAIFADEQYEIGLRLEKQGSKDALQFYERASDAGHSPAAFQLAELHVDGKFDLDPEKSAHYFRIAAENNRNPAIPHCQMGKFHLYGTNGFSKDPDKAIQYLVNASCKNDIEATTLLGRCHLEGIGASKNASLAIGYFEQALSQNPLYLPALIHIFDAQKSTSLKMAVDFMDAHFKAQQLFNPVNMTKPIFQDAELLSRLLIISEYHEEIYPPNISSARAYAEFILKQNNLMKSAFMHPRDMRTRGEERYHKGQHAMSMLYLQSACLQEQDTAKIQQIFQLISSMLDAANLATSLKWANDFRLETLTNGNLVLTQFYSRYLYSKYLKRQSKDRDHAIKLLAGELVLGNVKSAIAVATRIVKDLPEEKVTQNLKESLVEFLTLGKVSIKLTSQYHHQALPELADAMFNLGHSKLACMLYDQAMNNQVIPTLRKMVLNKHDPVLENNLWSYIKCLTKLKLQRQIPEILDLLSKNDPVRQGLEKKLAQEAASMKSVVVDIPKTQLNKRNQKKEETIAKTKAIPALQSVGTAIPAMASQKSNKRKKPKLSWEEKFDQCPDATTFSSLIQALKKSGVKPSEQLVEAINKYMEGHPRDKERMEQDLKNTAFEFIINQQNTDKIEEPIQPPIMTPASDEANIQPSLDPAASLTDNEPKPQKSNTPTIDTGCMDIAAWDEEPVAEQWLQPYVPPQITQQKTPGYPAEEAKQEKQNQNAEELHLLQAPTEINQQLKSYLAISENTGQILAVTPEAQKNESSKPIIEMDDSAPFNDPLVEEKVAKTTTPAPLEINQQKPLDFPAASAKNENDGPIIDSSPNLETKHKPLFEMKCETPEFDYQFFEDELSGISCLHADSYKHLIADCYIAFYKIQPNFADREKLTGGILQSLKKVMPRNVEGINLILKAMDAERIKADKGKQEENEEKVCPLPSKMKNYFQKIESSNLPQAEHTSEQIAVSSVAAQKDCNAKPLFEMKCESPHFDHQVFETKLRDIRSLEVNSYKQLIIECFIDFYKKQPNQVARHKLKNVIRGSLKDVLMPDKEESVTLIVEAIFIEAKKADQERREQAAKEGNLLPTNTEQSYQNPANSDQAPCEEVLRSSDQLLSVPEPVINAEQAKTTTPMPRQRFFDEIQDREPKNSGIISQEIGQHPLKTNAPPSHSGINQQKASHSQQNSAMGQIVVSAKPLFEMKCLTPDFDYNLFQTKLGAIRSYDVNRFKQEIVNCYIAFYNKQPGGTARKQLTVAIIQSLKTHLPQDSADVIIQAMNEERKTANEERREQNGEAGNLLTANPGQSYQQVANSGQNKAALPERSQQKASHSQQNSAMGQIVVSAKPLFEMKCLTPDFDYNLFETKLGAIRSYDVNSFKQEIVNCYIDFYNKQPSGAARKKFTVAIIQSLKTHLPQDSADVIIQAMNEERKTANVERWQQNGEIGNLLPAGAQQSYQQITNSGRTAHGVTARSSNRFLPAPQTVINNRVANTTAPSYQQSYFGEEAQTTPPASQQRYFNQQSRETPRRTAPRSQAPSQRRNYQSQAPAFQQRYPQEQPHEMPRRRDYSSQETPGTRNYQSQAPASQQRYPQEQTREMPRRRNYPPQEATPGMRNYQSRTQTTHHVPQQGFFSEQHHGEAQGKPRNTNGSGNNSFSRR